MQAGAGVTEMLGLDNTDNETNQNTCVVVTQQQDEQPFSGHPELNNTQNAFCLPRQLAFAVDFILSLCCAAKLFSQGTESSVAAGEASAQDGLCAVTCGPVTILRCSAGSPCYSHLPKPVLGKAMAMAGQRTSQPQSCSCARKGITVSAFSCKLLSVGWSWGSPFVGPLVSPSKDLSHFFGYQA